MANKLNVNLVLCQKYDDETKTIGKIFNEITTNAKHEATFSVITFMNGIDDGINDDEKNREKYLAEMLSRIEIHTGMIGLASKIEYQRSYCVNDFVQDYNAYAGNA